MKCKKKVALVNIKKIKVRGIEETEGECPVCHTKFYIRNDFKK